MHLRTPGRGRRLVAAAATLGLLGLPLLTSPADAAAGKQKAPAVKVMTRNLYLGANIMRPIAAVQAVDPNDPTCPGQCYQLRVLNRFANANDATQDMAFQTDYATRVKLLAGELATEKPDLVGLQEVALWRHGTFENPQGENFLVPNSTEVDFDFLKELLAELKAQGTPYRALSVNTLTDVEGPAYEGKFLQSDFANARDVRLTMRDVILQRRDSATTPVRGSAEERTYANNLEFTLPGAPVPITFARGYQWVDLMAGDRKFRFINTHLEAFGSDLAYAQAEELVTGPGAFKGRTILVCDCNSDPADGSVKEDIGDEQPHWGPYFRIVRAGFNDTWTQKYAPEAGFTSGLSERVDDVDASGFDHRIDMVFARTGSGDKLPVLSGTVTGDEVGDRDEATGLWPSDHAGVVMKLRLR